MLSSLATKSQLWKQCFYSVKRSYKASTIIPDLTKDRYQVKRGDFSSVTDADISHFQRILEDSRVLTDESDTESYNIDFMKSVRGFSRVVLKPKTTEEVSEILRHCNNRKLAVCPQGGNTGLVGGSVPVFDEVIISTQLMNRIENVDELSGILECQSGCILENLEEAVSQKGLCMPLDLGAKGSCHIGGNVSTNAGGIRLLRYGNLHGSVLGVEAVKADGTILDLMSNFKKDNTGYHLKHLFIGSEGTLGFLTKISMFCPTKSRAVNVAFLGLESYDYVLKTFLAAKRDLGEIISSCEMIDSDALDCSLNAFNLRSPIQKYPFYMLIETSGSRADHDEEKMNTFLKYAMESGLVLDGTVTNEPGKMKAIWEPRECIGSAIFKDCYSFSYDISLPLKSFYEMVDATKKQLGSLPAQVLGFGHIGDSNLHLIVKCKEYDSKIYQRLEPFVYEYTAKLRGSISSEHGIGFLKTNYLKYSKKSECFDVMKDVKAFMDPNGILNPYKSNLITLSPIADFPFYMLLETSGSNAAHDEEKLNKFLETAMSNGTILDGTLTSDPSKINDIWALRERIGAAILNDGYCFKYDISLPLPHFYEIVPIMKKRLGDQAKRICGYGHLGDANLHLNISSADYSTELQNQIEPFVYEHTASLRGSVSAEHGIGFMKTKYLKLSKSTESLDLMSNLKRMMDPNGILNPYKVLSTLK